MSIEAKLVMINALTIDVEDYFQVSAFAPVIARSNWEKMSCRVERNIDRILALLDERQIHATFFTLGWIAERYPEMVKSIVGNGHELASHGYAHHRVTELDRGQFQNDIVRSRKLLEDIGSVPVIGYRAPSFSINGQNLWTLDCLEAAGYQYSSSIYPVKHDHYGMPEAPRFAFHPSQSGRLLELPITTVRMLGRNFPAGGGGYFRFWPYGLSRWFLQTVNRNDQQSAIFYFHPWEIDPDQPRVNGIGFKTRFRHYVNLGRMETRLRLLTEQFAWGRMDHIFLKSAA